MFPLSIRCAGGVRRRGHRLLQHPRFPLSPFTLFPVATPFPLPLPFSPLRFPLIKEQMEDACLCVFPAFLFRVSRWPDASQDEPKWIPHARSAGTDANAHRIGYLRDIGAGIVPSVGPVGA
ncbi:hypothetical protein MSAN_01544400 [Mycena sanguinolenta]|uniref:Uncharacterized protein n=1 Tax=Mycena sanguinolenta TaxID=230812 RepID=A0A8H7CX42_9AGAR|nr:hypothetical protein MSAN_01544400 [Mycena sanguinolenta]